MIPRIIFGIILAGLFIGCSGGSHNDPITAQNNPSQKAFAKYTMTFAPNVNVHQGAHAAQADLGYNLLIEEGEEFPYTVSNISLNASLVDYDRGNNLLTVTFAASNNSATVLFDPGLAFFFDYTDSNGIINEPTDPYQVMSPDLDQDSTNDIDLMMLNIDVNGSITGEDVDDFAPVARLSRFQDTDIGSPWIFYQNELVITAMIRIPDEEDSSFENYKPIQWDILLVATDLPPDYSTPHSHGIDITSQRVPGYLVEDDETYNKALTCTLELPFFMTDEDAETDWHVYAWLDDFNDFTGWQVLDFDESNEDGTEMTYRISGIDADGLDPDLSPYVIRIKAEWDDGENDPTGWIIADDAYAYVVPDGATYDKDKGHYWIVYLEEHPDTGQYEFKTINTVRQHSFWLSGPDNYDGVIVKCCV
jgi:hypothetical protein